MKPVSLLLAASCALWSLLSACNSPNGNRGRSGGGARYDGVESHAGAEDRVIGNSGIGYTDGHRVEWLTYRQDLSGALDRL